MKYEKFVYMTVLGKLKRGKENAILSDELAKLVGITSRTNEFIREVIREMVEEMGYCIGSCSKGFYIIDDEDDLNATSQNLYARAISMLNRKKILEKNFQHERNLVL